MTLLGRLSTLLTPGGIKEKVLERFAGGPRNIAAADSYVRRAVKRGPRAMPHTSD